MEAFGDRPVVSALSASCAKVACWQVLKCEVSGVGFFSFPLFSPLFPLFFHYRRIRRSATSARRSDIFVIFHVTRCQLPPPQKDKKQRETRHVVGVATPLASREAVELQS